MTQARETCYRCHKPRPLCLCARTQRVANRTRVLIVQHRRERFHPVGTARLARLGLSAVELLEAAGSVPRPELPEDTALLYPAPDAQDLESLAPDQRPSCLLVLDGTWHHARRLYLDNPWLQGLRAVRLTPQQPSRYRIRRQARAEHLSTIESIVAALRLLEPDTPGLERLLESFDSMVTDQQAYMLDPASQPRRQRRRPRAARAVPSRLLENPERLLIVYGETAPLHAGQRGGPRQLLSWTALRPATGETFERLLQPAGCAPSANQLSCFELGDQDLARAVPQREAAAAWRAFRREDDLVAAWNSGRLRMLRSLDADPGTPLLLKALWCNLTHTRSGSLDELVTSLALDVQRPAVAGRAALRLGQAAAVARHLVRVAPRVARLPAGE